MKTIIELMQAEISNDKYSQSDFKHDVDALDNYEGWFLWMCRDNGTSLMFLSEDYFKKLLDKEAFRFFVYKNQEGPLGTMEYYKNYNDTKFFLGFSSANPRLVCINFDVVKAVYHIAFNGLFQNAIREHPDEYAVAKKQLPIKFTCSLSYVKKCLKKSEELGGNLLDELQYKRNYVRNYKDQWIEVGQDWSEHSFTFAEIHIENGDRVCTLNGGILFYDGKWHTHT